MTDLLKPGMKEIMQRGRAVAAIMESEGVDPERLGSTLHSLDRSLAAHGHMRKLADMAIDAKEQDAGLLEFTADELMRHAEAVARHQKALHTLSRAMWFESDFMGYCRRLLIAARSDLDLPTPDPSLFFGLSKADLHRIRRLLRSELDTDSEATKVSLQGYLEAIDEAMERDPLPSKSTVKLPKIPA